MFEGVMVAIVTPFADGEVDEEAFRRLINYQIENGVHCIVPCGTTGESPTLSHEEHRQVIKTAIDEVKGRVPVVAGTGSNSTAEAIALTRYAKEAGADGALMVSPYYNKPTQEGIYQHFKAVAEACGPAHHRLQHPGPDRIEHPARDHGPPGRDRLHCRGSRRPPGTWVRWP